MIDRGDGLETMLPPVSAWFRDALGAPTPPQTLGWPEIADGRSCLIVSPTGSGKTLAAFLAALDHLWRNPERPRGVGILYISPLKALGEDVRRNLEIPLAGIRRQAEISGSPLSNLRVAVRSGDTPAAERVKLTRKPPDILITTPESLHLMLTSRARETLKSVSHVIVDEIHALCPNKRGVFLAILLERLEALNPDGFVRVGLSATQKPLDEVARYLGGSRKVSGRWEPRPVTIVDAGRRKDLDLEVSLPGRSGLPAGENSIWPAIEAKLLGLIRSHRSTIVFANNRRVAERLTTHLNEIDRSEVPDEETRPPIAHSHHGSLSLDVRRSTEEALKAGELPSVVATASLELGIDMGAVDLVCQVESPGAIARGLQRVGRAGHVVGRSSKGVMIAKTAGDLLESAALAHAMIEGDVESLRVPKNCLDVLAQQVVACVAVDRWDVPALLDLMRGAYPYRDLSANAFESVLKLASGRFHLEALRDLRPRVSWDRVHNRLAALPGTAQVAIVGGGTIPDTGQYPLYLGEGGPKLGELDEEFVLERRVGETFVLGTSTWRIEAIDAQRVVVSAAAGRAAFVPFWRGEAASRTAELGLAIGKLARDLKGRLDDPDVLGWLRRDYKLDLHSAQALRDYVARQLRQAGAVPDDETVLIEAFRDPAGELGLAILTPFGAKLHHALKLALMGRLRERLGIEVACLHGGEGLLIRLPGTDDPPLDLFDGLDPDRAESLIRSELGDGAHFGLRFRQNAGRALLMPRPDPSKRTPLWLQRLRAKDLLQAVRRFPDFPIVAETFRECLDDDLDLPRFRDFLARIQRKEIRVETHRGEIPSPFTSNLVFRFTLNFMYEWDDPRRGDKARSGPEIDADLLDPLLTSASTADWLDPSAVGRVEGRLRGVGHPPRSAEEMADWLRRLGDLAPDEVVGPMAGFLDELRGQDRAISIELEGTRQPRRWIGAEDEEIYRKAFSGAPDEDALASIVGRFLRTHALIGLDDLTGRYPIGPAVATDLLERLADAGDLVRIGSDSPTWADRRNLEEVRRLTIAIKRKEAVAVAPETFADFVARRQHVHPETRREGQTAAESSLEQLRGFAAPAEMWESELLPLRIRDYRPSWLDDALSAGGWTWRAFGDGRGGADRVAIHPRDFAGRWPDPPEGEASPSADEERIREFLAVRGAMFAVDIAQATGLAPSRIRSALDGLVARGLATNDRFDPLRPAAKAASEAISKASSATGRPRLGAFRRQIAANPEGRWALIAGLEPDPESSALAWASALLDRYGILSRETAALDPWAAPWKELYPWLSRAEMRGELRRGYFVEGLSGVQYALPDAAEELARRAGVIGDEKAVPILLPTLDPANLYGSGAPLDVPLLEGGTARLSRSPGNQIVLIAGRPVLIIESLGRRLTGLASASEADLRAAMALLPTLAGPSRRVLKVETYNNAVALASPAAPWLADQGFVRDPPGMAFYAGW